MNTDTSDKHKFLEDAGMTFQQVYDFGYRGFISRMQVIANELGEDRFMEILKRASSEVASQVKSGPNNDFAAFTAGMRGQSRFWEHALTRDIIEDTDRAFEIRVTECLWAKTFREGGASDIGYASICHPDYAACQAFNPKIRMIRTKTLMQGDDHCDHRWVWEE